MTYDLRETVEWMLQEAITEAAKPNTPGPTGALRGKSKVRKAADQDRVNTLAEVLWNGSGRPGDLEAFTAELVARMG